MWQTKIFGTKVANENYNHKEIRQKLHSGNACYNSAQYFQSLK
jgi:hypothetical protein